MGRQVKRARIFEVGVVNRLNGALRQGMTIIHSFLSSFFLLFFSTSVLAADPQSTGMFQPHFGNMPEELAAATATNKRLLIYFWQEACPYCEQMEKDVFSLSKVKKLVGEQYHAIEINIFGAVDITGFSGAKTNEKGFSNGLKVTYTPTVIFFEKDGSEAFRLPGFWREPHFMGAVSYVSDGDYKKTSFQEFLRYKWFNPETKKEGGE